MAVREEGEMGRAVESKESRPVMASNRGDTGQDLGMQDTGVNG